MDSILLPSGKHLADISTYPIYAGNINGPWQLSYCLGGPCYKRIEFRSEKDLNAFLVDFLGEGFSIMD